jgi:hypothetical protein
MISAPDRFAATPEEVAVSKREAKSIGVHAGGNGSPVIPGESSKLKRLMTVVPGENWP